MCPTLVFGRACALMMILIAAAPAASFKSELPAGVRRPWIGPEYWSNPLQDWSLADGRIECIASGGDRNVHLLTHDLADREGGFEIGARLGALEPDQSLGDGFAGFKIGARGQFDDYRDSAVRGRGLIAGVTTDGRLFIGAPTEDAPASVPDLSEVELTLQARPLGGGYRLTLTALDAEGSVLGTSVYENVPADLLIGNVALVCHAGAVGAAGAAAQSDQAPPIERVNLPQNRGGNVRFWFRDLRVSGDKVDHHPGRAFGPILFTQHTLSRGVMKMTAQMPPLGDDESAQVHLWIQDPSGVWRRIATAPIDRLACTATFRIENWEDTRDVPYRVSYSLRRADEELEDHTYQGTVRRDPRDKKNIVVAAFTGNNDFGFPHNPIVEHAGRFDPDLLIFTGDQIYEPVGGYGIDTRSVRLQSLDYLRKWWIYGWAHRELFRDRPVLCLIDDHDVYHGNIWGAGGRKADGPTVAGQDSGGFKFDAQWVNAVQRTQTSHMPDPFDPAPVDQGIGVYYTDLRYGGVSFAIIEDRKWKSPPKVLLPEAKIINGWAQNPDWDAAAGSDAPGAVLLGDRQHAFLEHWAGDWSGGVWMKAVVSQTIFANVATLPVDAASDAVTPQLRIMAPGEYAKGERAVADHDSNGWPQTPRNEALRLMRKALAVHIAGDQHLGSTIQYGIDAWRDAGFAICVPSVANFFPRRWFPPQPGENRPPGAPDYAGDFRDGFGNFMTVHAVSNPYQVEVEPTSLNSRAPGYGIITFDRETRRITFANWPRWVDPSKPDAKPYPGWPITIEQLDNDGRTPIGRLATIRTSGGARPVVQVLNETTGELLYALRMRDETFAPPIFEPGTYIVRIGEGDEDGFREYRGLKPDQNMELGYQPRRRRQ